jgi:hypothetical protein
MSAVNNHYVSWVRANAIECVLDAMRNHPYSGRLAFSCVSSLRQLSSAKWSRCLVPYTGAAKIVNHGGIAAILGVMTTFDKSRSEETSGNFNLVSRYLFSDAGTF